MVFPSASSQAKCELQPDVEEAAPCCFFVFFSERLGAMLILANANWQSHPRPLRICPRAVAMGSSIFEGGIVRSWYGIGYLEDYPI